MTQEEVDFLTGKGYLLVSANRPSQSTNAYPTEAQTKVLVNAYPEKVMERPRDYRFKTRRGRGCRQKSTPSVSCLRRLERARSASIRVLHSWNVSNGNGYGMLFHVASGESPDERIHIVRICCFPACSCQDFWERETGLRTYVPCKHIYWVFLNIFRYDANQKMHSYMALLTQRNAQYATALREIIILSINLEETRIRNRHALEELQIYREDFKERTNILDGVVKDSDILDETLLQRFKAILHQRG
ncbi:hypothetical protein R1sor_006593 [Riccia sorocarpa]|uniref:SWIM-type domain-containing protein n=1 Tax=Riccia sorocarpa TaxID=122646 RepID=A0ABD3HN25_9MARC